ncbi:MAG: putative ribosomal methyltransferase, partial [Acidimicrobiales bacterium]|nr:putative ribosomal methyltransferase [Acidimicrobiales bacterium]
AAASRGALRVVAGSVGGLRLDAPPGSATRPTADRVRQATFNALESLGVVEGARVLDAFAGSGALGIEALSRGADRATFVDSVAAARAVVEANLRTTGLAGQARVVPGDGFRELAAAGPWDLVLLDPPYDYDRWPALLDAVAPSLAPGGVAVIESDHEVALPASLEGIRVRRYGSTVVAFASPAGATS